MSDFETAFEMTGHGLTNHLVMVASGLILLYATIESVGTGFILTAAQCDLQLSNTEKGWLNAATFIGIVTTAVFWGYIGDKYGRRNVMLPAMLATAIISLLSSFSVNFWNMFILRILTGAFVSASSATVYAYIGEMHINARRGTAIAWSSSFISFSFITLPALAWIILPGKWSFSLGSILIVPWRAFMWSWCIPGLVAVGILTVLPESPRFILATKGAEATIPILAKMYARNKKKKVEEYPVTQITAQITVNLQAGVKGVFINLGHMLRTPLLRCVLISHFSMYMVFLLSSGLYTWMPEMINQALENFKRSVSICTVMQEKVSVAKPVGNACEPGKINPFLYPMAMSMGVLCAFTFLSIGVFIAKFGKIKLYCAVVVLCAVMLGTSGVVPHPLVAVFLLVPGLCCGCAASVLAAIAVEAFPTRLRALALCTLYMIGRLGAATGANIMGIHQYCAVIITMSAIITAASTALMFFWPDSSKVRQQMEEKGFTY